MSVRGLGPVPSIDFTASLQQELTSRAKHKLGPTKKSQTRHSARVEDLILAFRDTTSKRRRSSIFFRLWFLNMKSRKIAVTNAIIVAALLPVDFMHDVIEKAGEQRASIGKSTEMRPPPRILRMITPPQLVKLSNTLRIVLEMPHGKGKIIGSSVLDSTKAGIASFAVLQAGMALMETILRLYFSDSRGKQERPTLAKMATELGVAGADKMTMDQLRVSIAQQIVAHSQQEK